MDVDAIFAALGNPVRRRVVELLVDGPRTAGDLAKEFDLSRSAVSEHLGVLRKASVVIEETRGRERHYSISLDSLTAVDDWLHPLERHWRSRLADLAALVEKDLHDDQNN